MKSDEKQGCPANCVRMTEDELEDRLALTSVASSAATLESVRDRLLGMAGNFFAEGKDENARLLRNIGNQYKEMAAAERKQHDILLKKKFEVYDETQS